MSKTQSYVVFCLKCVEYDSITHVEVVNETTKNKAIKKVKKGLNLDKDTNAIALTISEYENIMRMIKEMQLCNILNVDIGIGITTLFGMPISYAYDIIQTLKENQNLTLKDLKLYNPYAIIDIPEIKYDENS